MRRADDTVERYSLDNPHPEFSWRAMLGKVWYEGYPKPEYVWQSTGATDDFEPKMSLVPSIFGTIKATFYALVFAIPLAVFGALYTSQFVHPTIKAKVKPTVEIMAALPERRDRLHRRPLARLARRGEPRAGPARSSSSCPCSGPRASSSGTACPTACAAGCGRAWRSSSSSRCSSPVAAWPSSRAPGRERPLRQRRQAAGWSTTLGLVYDQRNSVVVGIAMGFAVIPIIFTISEDAFSSVPQHLTAASLALGASRWQTATRVVLPTASPGIFSAVMVGFGRAVGETMIVLMATGNTPLLDWSPFNGMRTLSANIAVEVPEAPYGGTLYRVLFLSACVLFLMTFLVNTVAELVRQRLRDKYKAI